jgi:hypothetical protein
MKGNTLTRSLNAFRHMALRPHHAARWARDRARPATPIDVGLPWFSYTCIDFLRGFVRPGMRVFEWGGGGSTVFFASAGCLVTTCESHEGWAEKIRERIAGLGPDVASRLELRVVPAESGDPALVRRYVESYLQGGPWDIVVIDGLEEAYVSRMDCVKIVADHPERIAPGGIVLLDDSWRERYDLAPQVLGAFERTMFWGLGPSRWGVTRTDSYAARPR